MLDGIARKLCLALVFVSACGWVVFVTGFCIRNSEEDSVVHATFTSHWLLSVCGVVAYFIYFLHLLWGNRVSAVVTLCVVPLYLGVVGAVLQFDSRDTQCDGNLPSLVHQDNFELHLVIEYSGALVSGAFMWLSLILWPLLKYNARNADDYAPINN